MASCGNCRFYIEGRCMRNAPTLVEDRAQWPAVSEHSWCGQHDAKEAAPDRMVPRYTGVTVRADAGSGRITGNPRSAEDIHD